MSCPCHNCEFRNIGCHAECEPYKAWQRIAAGGRERHSPADEWTFDVRQRTEKLAHRMKRK